MVNGLPRVFSSGSVEKEDSLMLLAAFSIFRSSVLGFFELAQGIDLDGATTADVDRAKECDKS